MNRGSLSRKTRGTDLRVLTLRNKVEDLKVVPVYLNTKDMLIDLGTKALDPKPFWHLCDQLCGYSERVSTVKLDVENYVDGSYQPKTKKVKWRKPVVEQSKKEDNYAPNVIEQSMEEDDYVPNARTDEMLEDLVLAEDKWEAALAMQPEAIGSVQQAPQNR
jgi:hypothetical protein